MVKRLLVLLVAVGLSAPFSGFAEVTTGRKESGPSVSRPVPTAEIGNVDIKREVENLKKELENEKTKNRKMLAEEATENNANRSYYIIIGLVLGLAGIIVRYFPGREGE